MKRFLLAAVLGLGSNMVVAGDVTKLNSLTAAEFENISKDLVAAFSYKAGAPAEPLGILGFDVGVSISVTDVEASDEWQKVLSDSKRLGSLTVPKLYAQKGLPFDVDVGVYYFSVPDSNLDAWGAEVKYAVLDGGVAMPAIAVRGAVTKLTAGEQLKVDTRSVDVSISKGILMLTPYAGIGRVWSTSTAQGSAAALGEIDMSQSRNFIGVAISPGLINFAIERDSVGGVSSYNAKLGIAF